jgi:hypothetical protein
MSQRSSYHANEIISLFVLLMMLVALVAGQSRGAPDGEAAAVSISVTKASKVATEPSRRPAPAGRRLFD